MIAPAESPLARILLCIGCHSRQLTSFVCPFIGSSSRNVRMSNIRISPSPPAVATRWPCGFQFTALTTALCECLPSVLCEVGTYSVLMSLPDLGSQNLTNMSLLPETTSPFVGCQSTHLTSHPWPGVRRFLWVYDALTAQNLLLPCLSIAPDLDQTIVTPRHEFLIVRTPCGAVTRFAMTLKSVDIGQMRRKVFNHAQLVHR